MGLGLKSLDPETVAPNLVCRSYIAVNKAPRSTRALAARVIVQELGKLGIWMSLKFTSRLNLKIALHKCFSLVSFRPDVGSVSR